jgi:cation transport regulator
MPYPTNADLPPSVRSHLPEHAQDIYREAFNHAFAAHAGEARQEEAAHRIAWTAVKHAYVKVGNTIDSNRNDCALETNQDCVGRAHGRRSRSVALKAAMRVA